MWIKTMDGGVVSISDDCLAEIYTSSNGILYYCDDARRRIIYESPKNNEAEAQEVLDYIWHRLEMNKNTCDLTRFKNREAERSAEWPGCEYDDKPKVHRNFEYEGIPEADK